MRLQTFVLTNLQLTSDDRLRNVKDLFRFSWESEDDIDYYVPKSDEEWQEIEDRYNIIRTMGVN